jgi:anti-sigma factor RsiW
MTREITNEDILLLVYGELNPEDKQKVELAIAQNPELKQYLLSVQQSKQLLNTISEEPHPTSVAIIQEFSHDSHTEAV